MRLNRQGPSEMRNAAAESGAADKKSKQNRRPRSSFTLTRIKKLERERHSNYGLLGKPMQTQRKPEYHDKKEFAKGS